MPIVREACFPGAIRLGRSEGQFSLFVEYTRRLRNCVCAERNPIGGRRKSWGPKSPGDLTAGNSCGAGGPEREGRSGGSFELDQLRGRLGRELVFAQWIHLASEALKTHRFATASRRVPAPHRSGQFSGMIGCPLLAAFRVLRYFHSEREEPGFSAGKDERR